MPPKKEPEAPKECFECALLSPGERPERWRKIDQRSGPRTPRCFSHMTAEIRRRREQASASRSRRLYGMEPEDEAELEKFQGYRCPCGNRFKARDHDHRIAREHCEHPHTQACKRCMRGKLCTTCNSDILGRGYNQTRLRALIAYLDNPPAQILWGSHEPELP